MRKIYLDELSKMTNLPTSKIRFYDKKGLMPFLKRDENNYRYIHEDKLDWINTINCLKKSGMSLEDIKKYLKLAEEGENTYQQRLEMILAQEIIVKNNMEELKKQQDFLNYKKTFYKEKMKK